MEVKADCIFFSGFKPCRPFKKCEGCLDYRKRGFQILYIHTGGLGDIVRSLGILKLIEEKSSAYTQFTVVTSLKGKELFLEKAQFLSILTPQEFLYMVDILVFDLVYNLDRDRLSAALATKVKARLKKGFCLDENGVLGVFNDEAKELFYMGLDDQLKFFENKNPAHQVMAKAMGVVEVATDFPYHYSYQFPQFYQAKKRLFREELRENIPLVIGVNLGVGHAIPTKALSFSIKKKILERLSYSYQEILVVLLGGEDEVKEAKALEEEASFLSTKPHFKLKTFITDDINLGALAISSLDLLVTGDTFALHLGLALNIEVVTWFGPTHPEEIITTQNLQIVRSTRECSPCWKKKCPFESCCNNDQEIFDGLIEKILSKIEKNFQNNRTISEGYLNF